MDEKILERMLNNLIEEAGPIAIENMEKEDSYEDVPDVEFSEKHEKKMKEIFEMARKVEAERANNKENVINAESGNRVIETDFTTENVSLTKKVKKRSNIGKKRLAVIIAATMVLLGLTITSVSAWRESFSKYFLDKKEKYSDVKDFKPGSELYIDNIYFGYIPDGFKFVEKNHDLTSDVLCFCHSEKYFILKIQKDTWSNQINTESGETCDLIIDGKEMVYYENNSYRSLSWRENGYIYILDANCDRKILEEIATNIKFVE